MYTKTITYTDYNGVERTEQFYFNLNKAEMTKLQFGSAEGMDKRLARISESGNNHEILKVFEEIVRAAYGVKSEDGVRFMKSKELTDAFMQSEAYSEFFMELMTSETAGSEFIYGIIPQAIAQQVKAQNETKKLN